MIPLSAIYINPWVLALAIILVTALLALAIILVIRSYERKVATGKEDMVGRTAIVRTPLNPNGEVFVEDELWNAVIDKGAAEPDEEVIITRIEGLKLTVTKK